MTKKMTRKEALEMAIEIFEQRESSMFDDELQDAAIEVLTNMVAQIEKQAARPKGKSEARRTNEKLAMEFIAILREYGKPVNATWMTEHIKYCYHSQKAVAVAKVAEEWGAIKRITIKGRTYYEYDDTYKPIVKS